jgi:tetratricopeptide (TPR) repeat protein
MELAERQQKSVPILLEHSLVEVGKTARKALAVIGLLALEPFDQTAVVETLTTESNQGLLSTMREIFSQKSKEELPNVSTAIRRLVDYGLLEPVGQRHKVSHHLIHAYARRHLTVSREASRRLVTSYVSLAWEQSKLGPDGDAQLDADRPHLMRLLAECIEWEDWEAAYGLATAIEDYLDRQGYWTERVIANETGLVAAWQLQRPSEEAWLGNLGDAYRTMGHARWAIDHFEKALDLARQTGNRHSEGNSLGNLGLAYHDLGQIDKARSYLEQSLATFEQLNSPSANLVRDWLAELEEE